MPSWKASWKGRCPNQRQKGEQHMDPLQTHLHLGGMAGQKSWYAHLVARAGNGPPERSSPQICKKDMGNFSNAQGVLLCHKAVQWLHCAPALDGIDWDAYLLLKDMRFGAQDYCLCQLQKTLAYVKALQHWAKEANPPMPGKLHQLAECICELQESMESLTTFSDAKIFGEVESSNGVWVTCSKSSELAESTHPIVKIIELGWEAHDQQEVWTTWSLWSQPPRRAQWPHWVQPHLKVPGLSCQQPSRVWRYHGCPTKKPTTPNPTKTKRGTGPTQVVGSTMVVSRMVQDV